jgi:hypothetical protein
VPPDLSMDQERVRTGLLRKYGEHPCYSK